MEKLYFFVENGKITAASDFSHIEWLKAGKSEMFMMKVTITESEGFKVFNLDSDHKWTEIPISKQQS